MKCVIQCSSAKILGKAVHTLARIGDEVFVETSDEGLVFRTVNSSHSAYVCFKFTETFFLSYNNENDIKCKIPIKSLLIAFKSTTTIEKSIETCSLELNNNHDNFIINNYCKHDLIKSYHLCLIESEKLEAILGKNDYKNKIIAKSRMMIKTIQNFPATVEEITLIITNEKVVMKNYVDDEPDPNQIIHTELTLEKEEFEQYELEEEAIITFSLKELRAIISFAESCNVPIVINFQTPGKPILFELQEIPGLEAEFLLATLAENSQMNTSLQQSNNTSTVLQTNSNANLAIERLVELSVADTNTGTSLGMKDQNPSTSTAVTENVPSECSNENEEEEIPSTPPSKKFRRMFLGLSSPSRSPQYTTVIPDPDEILAEASDED